VSLKHEKSISTQSDPVDSGYTPKLIETLRFGCVSLSRNFITSLELEVLPKKLSAGFFVPSLYAYENSISFN
jgi:hypothetical protein